MHQLRDGDRFRVWDAEGAVVFEGVVKLRLRHDVYSSDEAHVFGWWVHEEPDMGIDRETWARWFFDELPAALWPRP